MYVKFAIMNSSVSRLFK